MRLRAAGESRCGGCAQFPENLHLSFGPANMEEIRHKLSVGPPPVVEAAVNKLADSAAAAAKRGPGEAAGDQAVALLWEGVRSQRPAVARACSGAILGLVRAGAVDRAAALSGFLSAAPLSSPGAGCPSGLAGAVAELAPPLLTPGKDSSKSPPPHPFVSLLRSFPESWPHVHSEVRRRLLHSDNRADGDGGLGLESSLASLRSLFVFAFCDPHDHPHLAPLRSCLLDTLLEVEEKLRSPSQELEALLTILLTWLNFGRASCFYENCRHAVHILRRRRRREESADGTVPVLLSLALQGFRLGVEPRMAMDEAMASLGSDKLSRGASEVSLLVLAAMFEATTTDLQGAMVNLTGKILERESKVSKAVLGCLLAAFLQGLPHRKRLPQSVNGLVKKLLSLVRNCDTDEDSWEDKFEGDLVKDGAFFLADEADAIESLRLIYATKSARDVQEWISGLNKSSVSRSPSLFRLLTSRVIVDQDTDVVKRSFSLIVQSCQENPLLSHGVITAAMHKLANQQTDPEVQISILQQLPALAKDKSCISFILQLVNSLGSRPGLAPLRLHLFFRLWQTENRVYPYLKRALEEPAPEASVAADVRLSKARVVRDVCRARPSAHGADLLPLLSGILNECVADAGAESAPAAVATMEGIAGLCREGVIDIRTTAEMLSPKLWEDHREAVVGGFLKILELVPTFGLTSDAYLEFRKSTLGRLWKRLSTEQNPAVRKALFKSVACFQHQDHTLAMLPSMAKEELRFPSNYQPPADGPPQRPEDVLTFVPGSCWIRMICLSSEEDLEGYLVVAKKLFKEEILGLPRGSYFLPPSMRDKGEEPSSYNGLPESSILRAATVHLLWAAGGAAGSKSRTRAVAGLLAEDVGRPLPPFDWVLLQRLECREELMRIAALQCSSSR